MRWGRVGLGTVCSVGLPLAVYAALRWSPAATPLKLYPVLINAGMLFTFGLSLLRPPSAVERMARLTEPYLSAAAVVYTRRVTMVWCGFFLLNGSIALATAAWASAEIWTLYNGVIAYALMGALFAIEYAVRRRVRAHE